MIMEEETIFTSKERRIIDADCKKSDVIVLLKGRGENIVQLNSNTILTCTTGFRKIRFTKEHFCLLEDSTLSFYTLGGRLVSEKDVGEDVFELIPYKQGVLCVYGDEGVFGKKLGKNRLNYAAPLGKPESYAAIADQNHLLYEALFARYKPYACLNWQTNRLLFLNEQLERERTIEVPFDTGNVIAFALTHEFGAFIEEHKLRLWEFETAGRVSEYPGKFSTKTKAIFHRHDFLFVTILNHEVRAFRPSVKRTP
ncbi:hypothetical protein B0H99_107118 [Planomicrobium soli]|uniref:Uncharacterized protein n=1 Tax=Planomicrobium soli TaxID=1176648 RepID=A0A2P8GQR4_9BACL|nr:hypothetical protein [Planomicrobium soli]PSL36297.1 hypothetical protein B0H99_107118 [Planomicrobium soli]